MKVILYMATTPNGFIAKENGDSNWTSEADQRRYDELSKSAGNVIIGRKTYEALKAQNLFPLPGRYNVVITHQENLLTDSENVLITNKTPQEVLGHLQNKGFETAFVAGGGELNGSFMAAGLLDELYLTIEPLVFGRGLKLFGDADFENKLELIESTKLSDNELQLHYRVLK